MKKTKQYLFALILCIPMVFAGCTEKQNPEQPETGHNNKELLEILDGSATPVFEQAGGETSITFNSPGKWLISSDQGWCKVSQRTGEAGTGQVTITCEANETYDERNALVKIMSGTLYKSIQVTQKQKGALLLASSKVEIGPDGGKIKIEVKSSVNFNFSVNTGNAGWISPARTKALETHVLEFDISANESFDKRQGTIVFTSPDTENEETVTVYQKGQKVEVVLSRNRFVLDSKAQDIKIELTANVACSMSAATRSWFHDRNTKAASSTFTRFFHLDANTTGAPREATVNFSYQEEGRQRTEVVNICQQPDQPMPQLLLIRHGNRSFTAPLLEGTADFKGLLLWGNGSDALVYSRELFTGYDDSAASHTVVLASENADEITLKSLEGVQEIDLAGF